MSVFVGSNNAVSLNYHNQEQVHAAAKLHQELLGGPIPQLGYEFMTKFYYTKLVEAGLIKCDLYKYQGQYVAFSVYTRYPFTFMEEGKRRYFLYLSVLLFKSLLLNPYRIKTLLNVVRMNRKRRFRKEMDKIGEMLSFGVLKLYSNLRDEATGLRVSNLLFEKALDYLKREGLIRMWGEIQKGNKSALLLWQAYGGTIKECNWTKNNEYLINVEL